MAKRQSAKARAASLRNLRKARAARRGKTHTKTVRRRARRSSESPKRKRKSGKRRRARRVSETPRKRKRGRARHRLSRETPRKRTRRTRRRRKSKTSDWKGKPRLHRRAAKKGWARRRKRSHPHHKPKKRKKTRGRSTKRSRAARKGWATRRAKGHAPKRKRRYRRSGLTKAERAAIKGGYGGMNAAHERRRGRRRGRRKSNPLDLFEIGISVFTATFGFMVGDLADRFIATHALTDKGSGLYADNPPTTGSYIGLFNPTAIAAPMDWMRWGAGLVGGGGTIFLGHVFKNPKVRAGFQTAGFGWLVRVVGKGGIDLAAYLSKKTKVGQQLYDGEMRAAVLKANNGNGQAAELATLPSAGLGKPAPAAATGAAKVDCPTCAEKAAQQAGAGYPSMPREVAPPTGAPAPTPGSQMQPPPAAQLPPPPPGANLTIPNNLTGVRGAPVPVRRRFNWGEKDA